MKIKDKLKNYKETLQKKINKIQHKNRKTLSYKDISVSALENEIHRENYKHSFSNLLKSTIYILIIILALSSISATLFMPVIEITDSSMKPLLNDNEIVLSLKIGKLKKGDIITFYHGNKILAKRVIATQGDFVNIDENGIVYVNGNKIEENYAKNFQRGDSDIKYPLQVSDNSYFVLSDERDNMTDSRNEEIGLIKKENIIGKIIFRIWPFKKIGTI